jgi:hypothetical protein
MDINELNKTQLVLLTLLITFVVSIATGIVTVSLMQKAPKTVPQLVNNVIERTIEKVSTDPSTTTDTSSTTDDSKSILLTSSDSAVVSISGKTSTADATTAPKEIGQGVIVSDVGLILVDSSILVPGDVYTVTLNTTTFDVTLLKTYLNGFSILKMSPQASTTTPPATTTTPTGTATSASPSTTTSAQ